MQMHTLILSTVLVAFGASCKNKKELPDAAVKPVPEVPAPVVEETGAAPVEQTELPRNDSLFFSLERTPCFGSCPAYKITILKDGSATYFGRRFAAREGQFTGKVDAATMAQLVDAVNNAGFYAMEAKYDQPVTDLPSVIIRVHADERDKQVIGRVGSPLAFKQLTQTAEKLLANVEWTKVEEEH